jgi:hypothetical protein
MIKLSSISWLNPERKFASLPVVVATVRLISGTLLSNQLRSFQVQIGYALGSEEVLSTSQSPAPMN